MNVIISQKLGIIDSKLLEDYILSKISPTSHLKIQKIFYYVSGFHLAYFNQDLIDDEFEAWVHGPVSRKIYRSLKNISTLYYDIKFGGDKKKIDNKIKNILSSVQYDLINQVIDVYKKYTGIELEALIHSEKSWLEARKGFGTGDKCNVILDKTLIKEGFLEKLNS